MKSIRKEKKFSNLIELFQNLADKENRQKVETTVNLTRQKEAENESKRENNKDEENKKDDSNEKNDSNDKKNKCFRCDRSSHSKEKCSTINSECTKCHKTDH